MKKIMIIDGGPRRNVNTAGMLQAFAEGAKSAGKDVEVKTVRLYDLDYKGCMSCMACKIKGRVSHICKFKDALTPILEEIAQADGLVLGSPIYFGDVTGQMRTFLEPGTACLPLAFLQRLQHDRSQANARRADRDHERNAGKEQQPWLRFHGTLPVIGPCTAGTDHCLQHLSGKELRPLRIGKFL